MNEEALLVDLDDDQKRAVTCAPTATIVHAGAGSGKTRVLTHRIAWRIAHGDIDPARVLAITFTREAAAEMRRRLRSLGVMRHDRPGDTNQPTIGTFHAIALALLRRRASDTSAVVPTVVGNRSSLLNQALGEQSLGRNAQVVLGEIDWAHARMVSPDRYVREVQRVGRSVSVDAQRIALAYGAYEQLKAKRGLADLDELIALATRALHDRPDFAAATRFRFRHLFVDEAQDMNPLQYSFFEALRGNSGDVFIVGDPLQSIYGWNGADPALFRSLPDALPRPTVLTLPSNYRCTPQVLEVATH
ncbi:MAG: ATP-dependent helicase, partial [Actinomycetota bacterium]